MMRKKRSAPSLSCLTFTCLAAVALALEISPAIAADGDLDPGFGTAGKTVTAIHGASDWDEVGQAVAFQPDGKILVSGYYWNGDDTNGYFDLFVARYCQNGTLDNGTNCGGAGFGTNGIASIRVNANEWDYAPFDTALQVLPDGKILVGGDAMPGGGTSMDIFLVRLTSSGALDTSFDSDGKVYVDIDGNGGDYFKAMARQPDGKIIVVGYRSWTSNSLFVARFNDDGSLDTSFNGDGKNYFQIGGVSTVIVCMALQADGKILVGGYTYTSDATPVVPLVLARLTNNGDLDTTFSAGDGTNGYYANDLSPGNNDSIAALALRPDGKIMAVGYKNGTSPNSDFAVFRFNGDGTLDTGFDGDSGTGNGIVITQVGAGTQDLPSEILLQSDGKFIVGGRVEYGNPVTGYDLAILRYNSNGSIDTTFGTGGGDGDGIVLTDITTHEMWGMGTITPDGRLVVVGSTGDWDTYRVDVLVARYLLGASQTSSSMPIRTETYTSLQSGNLWAQFNSGHACGSGIITVQKRLAYPGGAGTAGELPLSWDLGSDCTGEFGLNLKFCYTDQELAAASGATEANLKVYKFSGGTWTLMGGTVDTACNCVTLTNVTGLSSWTLSDPTAGAPTAVVLSHLQARSGHYEARLWSIFGPASGLAFVSLACCRRRRRARAAK